MLSWRDRAASKASLDPIRQREAKVVGDVRIGSVTDSFPIACSLNGDAARRRWEEWTTLLRGQGRVEHSRRSLTVAFGPDAARWEKLVALVASERECCGFVEWELDDLGSEIVLTLRGEKEGLTAMAESFGINA